MSNLIESVWDLAGQFMVDPMYVTINEGKIKEVAEAVAQWIKYERNEKATFWGLPKCIKGDDPDKIEKLVLYELIANSVNYCYWYGRSDIRPNGANSVKMSELLDHAFGVAAHNTVLFVESSKPLVSGRKRFFHNQVITQFYRNLALERFPLLEQRARHLKEISGVNLGELRYPITKGDVDGCLKYLVTHFPGYGNDLFLKRAILFVMQLHRRICLFGLEQIKKLPVPADYQVPKILRYLGCIDYTPGPLGVGYAVGNSILIPEGSRMECEIRAATIVACKKIADYANCSCEQVDSYLWLKRNECRDSFHLCITTSY